MYLIIGRTLLLQYNQQPRYRQHRRQHRLAGLTIDQRVRPVGVWAPPGQRHLQLLGGGQRQPAGQQRGADSRELP